jgi:hypothetical protein
MDEPPPYEAIAHQQKAYEKATGLRHDDPRSSSQQSLAPATDRNARRKLLLVYIHGFMGNETSFRSFPAHVHNLLVILLSETHVVHTKIYPRYRSRGKITIARDDFSKWMQPHEDDLTDIVLLGHSMGGLLAAEVVLAPSSQPAKHPLRHRILGTINFDVPFLGMHPGVVKSGLTSIFKPADVPKDDWESSLQVTPPPGHTDTLWAPGKNDPNYNPSFTNDVVLPVRKGWRNAWHFISKHSDDLTTATKKLVSSHLEFGGAMANFGELKGRYGRVRALEEADEPVRQSVVEGGVPPRVRFINYYTASTGRIKKPDSLERKPSASQLSQRSKTVEDLPPKPEPLNINFIQDPKVQRIVEQEHSRAVEAYDAAVKKESKPEAELTHREREEFRLEKEKQRMEREGRRLRGEPDPDMDNSTSSHLPIDPSPPISITDKTEPKDRKFCTLPPKDSSGERDPCWIRIFMPNVDEVGAHCGLFFVDARYERLVGDVASRVEGWVLDENGRRRAEEGW